MYKVLAIVGEDLSIGFSLVGIDTHIAESPVHAAEALEEVINGDEYGIVIIDQDLASHFDEKMTECMLTSKIPLVISISGQMRWGDTEALPTDDHVAKLIRHAIGYQLNIEI